MPGLGPRHAGEVTTRSRFGRGARHRRSACANRLLRARGASRRSTAAPRLPTAPAGTALAITRLSPVDAARSARFCLCTRNRDECQGQSHILSDARFFTFPWRGKSLRERVGAKRSPETGSARARGDRVEGRATDSGNAMHPHGPPTEEDKPSA